MNPFTYLLRNLIRAEVAKDGSLTRQEIRALADQTQQLTDQIENLATAVTNAAARFQAVIDDLRNHPAAADIGPQLARLQSITDQLNAEAQPAQPAPSA